jgi:hypothetical protein
MGIATDTIGRNGLGGAASGIGGRLHETVSSHTCLSSSAEYELALILKEIRFITEKVSSKLFLFCFFRMYFKTFGFQDLLNFKSFHL